MTRPFLLSLLVLCFAAAQNISRADESADAQRFTTLAANLKHALPAGWKVESDPAGATDPDRPELRPAIVIRSIEPMRFEPSTPNPPAQDGEGDQPPAVKPFVIRLVVAPFISPEDHPRLRQENEARQARRLEFEQARLKNVSYGHMGGQPIPPRAYEPASETERQALLEYSLLWIATEPARLPSHHYQSISFDLIAPFQPFFADPQNERDVRQMLTVLENTVRPYVEVAAADSKKADEKPSVDATERFALEGRLQIHPKFLYRYYIVGFGDGQQCALFNDQLKDIPVGSWIRVEGKLGTRFHKGSTETNLSPFPPTCFIYMDVETVTVLRRAEPPAIQPSQPGENLPVRTRPK